MHVALFEWIVLCGKKEYCLTENQYEHLLKNQDKRFVVYDTFSINPAYVSASYQQPAKKLKSIYPCGRCGTKGFLYTEEKNLTYQQEKCPVCAGTGIDLQSQPNKNALALIEEV